MKGALGEPSAPSGERGVPRKPGDRRDRPREEDPAAEARRIELELLNDPSRIAIGGRQLNAAAFAANRPDPQTRNQQADERRRKADEAYSRELQRYAEWSAKVVTIGGVQMTNGEAQEARRRFIEDEDHCAENAVRRGHIRDGEQGALKRAMRRKYDLEDRVGRGIATEADTRELDALNRSRIGHAVDVSTAEMHTGRAIEVRADAKASIAPAGQGEPLPTARDIFQSTPVAQQAFAQAADPTVSVSREAPAPAPAGPSREAKATGLNI